ncbi:MAG: VC0807 family protein [Luteolibacter sp.]
MPDTKPNQEHPLANILINVLIPVVILSYLSKDPALQEQLGKTARFWHIGPLKAMILALILPLGYGIWHFIRTRKGNFFSALGLVSVLLTGGLTLYLWNKDGSVKPNAAWFFSIKEAIIPLILGIAVLTSHRTSTPLIRTFLYNDSFFDIPKIENRIASLSSQHSYATLLRSATRMFASSFFISSLMNLGLVHWFFRGFNSTAPDALEVYNQLVGKITGYAFLVIGVPIMLFLFLTLKQLVKGLRGITGFTEDELMLPR